MTPSESAKWELIKRIKENYVQELKNIYVNMFFNDDYGSEGIILDIDIVPYASRLPIGFLIYSKQEDGNIIKKWCEHFEINFNPDKSTPYVIKSFELLHKFENNFIDYLKQKYIGTKIDGFYPSVLYKNYTITNVNVRLEKIWYEIKYNIPTTGIPQIVEVSSDKIIFKG